jgi:hypothetical protein
MKMKFYTKTYVAFFTLFAMFASTKLSAQNQGMYLDTVKWPNSNSITVNISAKGFNNVINFQGGIQWDKNTLQYISAAINPLLVDPTISKSSNISFGTSSNAITKGVLTYLFSDTTKHTLTDGTTILSVNFNVINNPVSTYSNNEIFFSSNETTLGIDTVTDAQGLSDYGSVSGIYSNGYVSFARPAVLSNNGTNITDSVTNRPLGCTYQWFQNGNAIAGPASSNYPNAPAGLDSVRITYPNGTVVSCIAAVLPIKLNSFNGRFVDNTNQLSWSTSSEINTNIFDVERSINGKDFVSIGKVKAIGNSATPQYYSFADANVNGTPMYYYRLKSVDNNGSYSYSNVIKIAKDNKTTISLYPNPSKSIVTIEGDKIEKIVVTNLLGKTVLVKNVNAVNNTTLNVSGLAKGFYNVNVMNVNSTKSLKLIVD